LLRSESRLPFVLLCFLLVVPSFAVAQDLSLEVAREDRIRFFAPTVSGQTGLFETVTADTLRQGQWSFGIYYNNYDYLAAPARELAPLSRREYRDMDIEHDQLSASIGVGLTDRWEVSAMIPYVRIENNAGDLAGYVNGYPYVGRFRDTGLGSIRLATKLGLSPVDSPTRFALSAFVGLPTGSDDSGIATGSTDFGIGGHLTRGSGSLSLAYVVRGDRDGGPPALGFQDFELPNEVRLDAGYNRPLGRMGSTNWISEINTIFYTGGNRSPDTPVYLLTGLRHWFGTSGWALNAALRANATMWTSDNNSCPFGGLVGLTFAPLLLTALPPPPPPILPPPPPPAPVVPPPAEPVAPPRQPQEIRTDEIHFEAGSARLTNIAKAILDEVALRMRQEPSATALVIGYTDNRENTGANRDLDRRRAEAVRDYLVSRHGIDPSRITVEGRGTSDSVGDNATAEGRLRNRRVVIRLTLP
jgi:outer membrane protein OmpA-like peptidoglycan-associated protein